MIRSGGALALAGMVGACSDGSTDNTSNGNGSGTTAVSTTTTTPPRGAAGDGGGTVTLRDVHIFDGERIIDADTLIVEGGLITAVGLGLTPPSGSEVYEGAGRYLLPGLIDAHVHTSILDQLGDSLRFGVCTVLDMFSLFGIGPQGDPLRAARRSLAPTDRADYWTAGYLTTVAGGHGTEFGVPVPVLAPGDDIDAYVAARAADGCDYVKIVIEDGSLFGLSQPTLTAEQVNALVAAAHRRDLLAIVHTTTWPAVEIALTAGADLPAHVPGGELPDDELVDRIVDSGMAAIATIAVYVGLSCADDATKLRDDPRIGAFLSDDQRVGLSGGVPGCRAALLDDAIANTAVLHEAGVPILAGTDFSNIGTAAGASLLLEVEMLVRAGLDPVAALRSATSIPAARFGLDDRGLLEVGRRGDLLLVGADPFDDIRSLRDISAIWKNGYAVDRSV